MEKVVNLVVIVHGDSVQANFYPYEARIDKSDKEPRINWLVRVIWTDSEKLPQGLQVSVQDFAALTAATPVSPYGTHSPTFTGQPQPAGVNELIWLIPGETVTSIPPEFEEFAWRYNIVVGSDDQVLHSIDPLVVISG
ncbi:MAG TPA: hypothetical protein VNI02_03525 [Blastocatellia bacterium]|nr:hypothetical protein [Blastocatellia bacterium]